MAERCLEVIDVGCCGCDRRIGDDDAGIGNVVCVELWVEGVGEDDVGGTSRLSALSFARSICPSRDLRMLGGTRIHANVRS